MAEFDQDQLYWSFGRIAILSICFRSFSIFVRVCLLKKAAESQTGMQEQRRWRIANEITSLVHAGLTGLWAIGSFLRFPQMFTDMLFWYDTATYCLVLVSIGYLIQDALDMLWNEHSTRVLELLFHHLCVISVLLCAVCTGRFLGLVACGLLMELNGVFLHSRSLLNLHCWYKNSTSYRIVSACNVFTFVVFRFVSTVYLLGWSLFYQSSLGVFYFSLMFFVMFSLLVVNAVLFYRVLSADGYFDQFKMHRRNESTAILLDETSFANAQLPFDYARQKPNWSNLQ